MTSFREAFALRHKGARFAQSGSNSSAPPFDSQTGFWAHGQAGKATRCLVHLKSVDSGLEANVPPNYDHGFIRLGQVNTGGSSINSGVVVFIMMAATSTGGSPPVWDLASDWVWRIAFRLSPGALEAVKQITGQQSSSSVEFRYFPATGMLQAYSGKTGAIECPYLFAGLLLDEPVQDLFKTLPFSYSAATAVISSLLKVTTSGNSPTDIPRFQPTALDIDKFYDDFFAFTPLPLIAPEADQAATLELDDLIGIPEGLAQEIAAVLADKRHLIIHGPPGTGKTTLARKIASSLGAEWVMVTGTADWTAHDVIGGYMPAGQGNLRFEPGLLLSNFDKVVIIDEFNRADLDKAFGPLFTVLSDQPVELPYVLEPSDPASPRIQILPEPGSATAPHEFAPGKHWRLICTLNTYDKASLFQLSYALSRRFGWIHLDIPEDLGAFVTEIASMKGWESHPLFTPLPDGTHPVLARVWDAINNARKIGPAAIIDVMAFCRLMGEQSPLPEWATILTKAMSIFVVPQLEGLSQEQSEALAEQLLVILQEFNPGPGFAGPARHLREQMSEYSV